jgi:hypothetical protein
MDASLASTHPYVPILLVCALSGDRSIFRGSKRLRTPIRI